MTRNDWSVYPPSSLSLVKHGLPCFLVTTFFWFQKGLYRRGTRVIAIFEVSLRIKLCVLARKVSRRHVDDHNLDVVCLSARYELFYLTTIYCECFFIHLLNTVFCYVYILKLTWINIVLILLVLRVKSLPSLAISYNCLVYSNFFTGIKGDYKITQQ